MSAREVRQSPVEFKVEKFSERQINYVLLLPHWKKLKSDLYNPGLYVNKSEKCAHMFDNFYSVFERIPRFS